MVIFVQYDVNSMSLKKHINNQLPAIVVNTSGKYSGSVAVGLGLTAIGIVLQICTGGIDWNLIAFPANLILVIIFTAGLVVMNAFRQKVHLFAWLGSGASAVVSICFAAALTAIMGLIRQTVSYVEIPGMLGRSGLRQMLSAWYFVLPFLWMTLSLGMTTIRVATSRWSARTIPFILNHLGLFIVLVCSVASSADMRRLSMTAYQGEPQWRAYDRTNQSEEAIELPIAIELNDFIMEEYPPKLMLFDLGKESFLPEKHPAVFTVGEDKRVAMAGWSVAVEKYLDNAAYAVADSSDVHYEGWVSCGSHNFPAMELQLGPDLLLVMPERSPKRYASDVTVYVQDAEDDGHSLSGIIEVNHPLTIKGWKIYQLGYDQQMGNDSEYSIFELVHDPWLPAVYVGIIMMLTGAVSLFLTAPGRNRKKEDRI
ncbi:MAG: cytochrome c biogenesis protein ResB [Bacteroidales bacterium]|nr:cytochrome c biogenesis protein ResB [Bacteroidales bacterium]